VSKKSYTNEEIIVLLKKGIEKNISTLYNDKDNAFIDEEKEKTKEGSYYYDVIAEYLLQPKNKDILEAIPGSGRGLPYKQPKHNHRQKEKRLAHGLHKTIFDDIGEILDFEIPLYKSKKDKRVGEFDMLAYNGNKKQYSIIELKNQGNTWDSLLHAILQVCTYYRQINKEKLIAEYENPSDKDIRKVVLIFKDSRQYRELKSEYMRKLAKLLKVEIFVLDTQKYDLQYPPGR